MKAIRDAVQYVLKHDPILVGLLGFDEDQEVKVYETIAKTGVEPPFVVWGFIQTGSTEGHYGDDRAIESKDVQVTAWGYTIDEAWQLFSFIEEALERGDMSVELLPYTKLRIVRTGDQQPLPDQETSWFQIPATYRVGVAR